MPQDIENIQPFPLPKKVLLGIYSIVPLLTLLLIADIFFFKHILRDALKLSLTESALYLLFLESPHIIASFVGLADTEYLRYYKREFFIFLPLFLIAIYIIFQINAVLGFVFYGVYTMYHAVRQQTGIGRVLLGETNSLHLAWSYAAILSAVVGNFFISKPLFLSNFQFLYSFESVTMGRILLGTLTILYLYSITKKNIGWYYILATSLLFFFSYICVLLGYLFFPALAARFIHDATAFTFYAVHDSNRNAHESHNFFYKLCKPLRFPILVITPLLGIIFAFFLRKFSLTFSSGLPLLVLLGFAHYYIESFIWKRGSLHHKQLRFA